MSLTLTRLAATVVLVWLFVSFGATFNQRDRWGKVDTELARDPAPSLECLTGYDYQGICISAGLKGGVHGFLGPGLAAALVAALGGTLGGVGVGYAGKMTRGATRSLLSALEALPRLVIVLLVYSLWNHSMLALGLAVGVLTIPVLAGQIDVRIRALERADFFRSTRAHGIKERRVLFYHTLWLSCRGDIIRNMIFVFGNVLVVETSLSYALQCNTSTTEWSWGHLLQRTTLMLYGSVAGLDSWLANRYPSGLPPGVAGAIDMGKAIVAYAWTHGVPQFVSVVLAIVCVLWATHVLGEGFAHSAERER